jgi:hypothetical protein
MSRKVFAAGEILTAADSNEFLIDQNVMSFADSTARGSAIGTAVQGMVTYLNDIDTLSIYNGTDWTVDRTIQSFADSTARGSVIGTAVDGMASWLEDSDSFSIYNGSSWQSVGAGETLVFLTSETFSSVASMSINDVFSADYTNYKVVLNALSVSVDAVAMRLRVRASGSDLSSLTYEFGRFTVGAAGSEVAASQNSQAQNSVTLGKGSSNVGYGSEIYLYNPFALTRTRIHQIAAGFTFDVSGGIVVNSLSYDGLTVFPDSGTITGTMTVYGIKES